MNRHGLIRQAYRKRDGYTSARGHEHLRRADDIGAPFPNRSREEARRRAQVSGWRVVFGGVSFRGVGAVPQVGELLGVDPRTRTCRVMGAA